MYKSLLTLLILAKSLSVYSQAESEYKKIKLLYPGETFVYLNHSEEIDINLSQGKINMLHNYSEEKIFMTTSAGLYSSGSITYFDELSELKKVEAGTLIPSGNKYKAVKVKEFKEESSLSKSVFYQGEKSLTYFYPSLQPGAKTYLNYSIDIKEPRLMPSFYFQRSVPVLESKFTVSVPAGVEIDWKLFHVADSSIIFTEKKVKNKTVYSWAIKNLESFPKDDGAPNLRYFSPHIAVWVKSYMVDGKQKELMGKPEHLYRWYYDISKESNNEDSPELKKIVDSLTQNTSDTLEKVKRVFYWVQDNIKYIAIENGMEGFVPRSGKLVCERRFGDCKDMASIMNKMLTYAGIPSHLTWIGSRDIPYKYEELSTPSVDNHMILTFKSKGRYYFLDATGRYIPFGLPTGFIQGKQALISKDENNFELYTVPVIPATTNFHYDSIQISLVNNKVQGKGISKLNGYRKINLAREVPSSFSDQTRYFRAILAKGSNKFVLDSFSFKNIYEKDSVSQINYHFTIEDYAKVFEKEIYINMLLENPLEDEEIKAGRRLDLEFHYTFLNNSVVTLTIPKGYSLKHFPENSSFKDKNFGFDVVYKKSGDELKVTTRIYCDTLMLKKEEFANWNKMISELNKSHSQVIILKKN